MNYRFVTHAERREIAHHTGETDTVKVDVFGRWARFPADQDGSAVIAHFPYFQEMEMDKGKGTSGEKFDAFGWLVWFEVAGSSSVRAFDAWFAIPPERCPAPGDNPSADRLMSNNLGDLLEFMHDHEIASR